MLKCYLSLGFVIVPQRKREKVAEVASSHLDGGGLIAVAVPDERDADILVAAAGGALLVVVARTEHGAGVSRQGGAVTTDGAVLSIAVLQQGFRFLLQAATHTHTHTHTVS